MEQTDERYTIAKEWSFDAAHQLPLHDGKCRELHGHTYRVRLAVNGPLMLEGRKSGMVIDFGDVSEIWKQVIEPRVDHRFLNDTLPVPHTTAEMIAGWMLGEFRRCLGPYLGLQVTVWETPTSWARTS